jgi:L-asparaginase
MRGPSTLSSDAQGNLVGAISVAACPEARGLGVVIHLDDTIHQARFVRKGHTSSTGAFVSTLGGPLGYMVEGRVHILNRPAGRLHVMLPEHPRAIRVATVTVGFDDDGTLLTAAGHLGFDALVLVGFGGGHVPSALAPIVEDVAGRIPLVLTSRTGAGEVLRRTYGYQGSEVDLIRRGAIPAGALDCHHAAVLLRLLLMAEVKGDEIGAAFEQASHPKGAVVLPAARPSPQR